MTGSAVTFVDRMSAVCRPTYNATRWTLELGTDERDRFFTLAMQGAMVADARDTDAEFVERVQRVIHGTLVCAGETDTRLVPTSWLWRLLQLPSRAEPSADVVGVAETLVFDAEVDAIGVMEASTHDLSAVWEDGLAAFDELFSPGRVSAGAAKLYFIEKRMKPMINAIRAGHASARSASDARPVDVGETLGHGEELWVLKRDAAGRAHGVRRVDTLIVSDAEIEQMLVKWGPRDWDHRSTGTLHEEMRADIGRLVAARSAPDAGVRERTLKEAAAAIRAHRIDLPQHETHYGRGYRNGHANAEIVVLKLAEPRP